ncbi:hypothetical protein BH09CHL1_BH09CHL1_09060 [soil metagenome]
MEQEATEQPEEVAEEAVYGPPMPGTTGMAKVGSLWIPGRMSIWLIYGLILLCNFIVIGGIILLALNRAGRL